MWSNERKRSWSCEPESPSTEAAQEVGYKSGDSVSQLVERCNQHGLAALLIAPGRGRKETYTSLEREHIVQEFRRAPDRQDDAGPYQAMPQPGEDWHLEGKQTLQPHAYVRGGTAKLLTLLCLATGDVRAKGVLSAPNAVLHPWLQEELQSILDQLD